MKKPGLITAGIFLFALFFNLPVNAQQSKASIYLGTISREEQAITLDSWEYISEIAHGKKARKMEAKRKDLIRTSKSAIDRVKKMDGFNGSTWYRDSVIAFLNLHYIILNEDYAKILNMEEIAEQSYDNMEAYMLARQLSGDKLDSAAARMVNLTKLFAGQNNINLLEANDKVSRKLESVGEVTRHYDCVYLIFFKAYKQEAYLIDALNRKDVNAIEQNKNALAAVSKEGLGKLPGIVLFKNDKSLVYACKSALEFYQKEASLKIDGLVDFYLQKENFDKITAAFESKPESSITDNDVTEYNNAVKEFNQRLNAMNKQNKEMDKERNAELNNWNNSAQRFLDNHIPKYKL